MNRVIGCLILAFMVLGFFSCGQRPAEPETDYLNESPAEKDSRMHWWREARFGMFIHWGLYAVPAGEYQGERVEGIGEWIQAYLDIPKQDYAHFADQFNPEKFDAARWVGLAKAAGMKYIVITSKHHDGFALFDSKVSKYDVVDATPYGRDILAQLKEECDRQGLIFCTYHSILDWHHPAQYVDREADSPRRGHSMNLMYPDKKDDYVRYMKSQLREILDNYDVGVMWFDGEWPEWWTREDGLEMYNWLRNLKPSLIINNRVGAGRSGMAGFDRGEGYAGDFGTPEQEIPDTGVLGVDWESCMTMNDTWGYKYFDENWKSAEMLIHNLIDAASKGGNYLLNVGPKADGTIPAASIGRLEDVGRWMAVNGDSIYGTLASPFAKPEWGRFTRKTGFLYAHVFDRPEDGTIEIPLDPARVKLAYLLDGGEKLTFSAQKDAGSEAGVVIELPEDLPDPAASVIVLEILD